MKNMSFTFMTLFLEYGMSYEIFLLPVCRRNFILQFCKIVRLVSCYDRLEKKILKNVYYYVNTAQRMKFANTCT